MRLTSGAPAFARKPTRDAGHGRCHARVLWRACESLGGPPRRHAHSPWRSRPPANIVAHARSQGPACAAASAFASAARGCGPGERGSRKLRAPQKGIDQRCTEALRSAPLAMTKQWEAKRRRPRRGAAVSSIKVEAPGIERDEVATTKLAVLLVFPRLRASSRHFPASWSSTGVHTAPREATSFLEASWRRPALSASSRVGAASTKGSACRARAVVAYAVNLVRRART